MTPEITMIPIASIEVLNPRARNRKIFDELVESVRAVGLKRPITVRRAPNGDGYELVCGQGRMEAFKKLAQSEIPAMIIEATREECFVMSLVENMARRNLTPLELIREVGVLRDRGYNHSEIARKIGFSAEYVWTINLLLEKGEERLLDAVERGIIPHTIATEIARAEDADVQRALTEAYESGSLPGDQILAIRRIVDDRNLIGKGIRTIRTGQARSQPTTAAALVRAYQREVERQKLLVKKATLTQSRLTFIVGAMAKLLAEDHFVTLLRAEGMASLPQPIAQRLGISGTSS
ncbi:plasmid partitioning protein RepB C-terminal domain-containing protein [Sphingomonas psychrotolerans]|uniref:Chromosome partitioning protein ParB n=1 Tax=Sphingomonas psychrotolerans TaxID=1327635 RepID=A0A2K8M9P5_9SPHN|nr:plasmid partitioning protein RepB C-terminal domain-containing protein [Sphingomonas psychrotolerans]ATY30608.1 chromosome partitioning protein ParB [Sphingomonas psychrotolerans]